jgi:hypothetical protein
MSLTGKQTPTDLQLELERQRLTMQTQNHKQMDKAPLVSEVPEGGIIIATVSGTSYIYTKVKGVLKRVALS